MFYCEQCEIFKNTYFEEYLHTTTSAFFQVNSLNHLDKKTILKIKRLKLIIKYENTFYLPAADGYEKKSLKCVIINFPVFMCKPVLQTCREQLILGTEFETGQNNQYEI